MKILNLTLFLCLSVFVGLSQQLKISNDHSTDSLAFYFNKYGAICNKSNAIGYRVTQLDTFSFAFKGFYKDYNIKDQLIFSAELKKGMMNGSVLLYYGNGNKKIEGSYKNNKKEGIWTYYYENGNVEKILEFTNDEPYFKSFYKQNGKVVFEDGTGKYKGLIRLNKLGVTCRIQGKIEKGKQEGLWRIASGKDFQRFYDVRYKNGKLVGNNEPYLNLIGFELYKEIDLFLLRKDLDYSSNLNHRLNILKYKENRDLAKTLVPEVESKINSIILKNGVNNFFILLQFVVNKDGEIKNIECLSTSKKIKKELVEFLNVNTKFSTDIENGTNPIWRIFLPIMRIDNQLYIPMNPTN